MNIWVWIRSAAVALCAVLFFVFMFAPNANAAGFMSAPVTNTQLRASPVPVSGPITDAQLRASAVPVSGPLTDAQLRAADFGTTTNPQSTGSGGLSVHHKVSAVGNNEVVVKGSPGKVYGIILSNASTTKLGRLQFHNSATAPTQGQNVFFGITAPKEGTVNISFPFGVDFSQGIAISMVDAVGSNSDANTNDIGADVLAAEIFYK